MMAARTRRLWAMLAGLLMLGGIATAGVVTAGPARAATLYGLCSGSYCAREGSVYFDRWPRDISGDGNQQMQRQWQGVVSSARCWPFKCGSGLNATYDGSNVYKYYNIHTGHCMSPDNLNNVYIYADACNANGTNWVQSGGDGSAFLINVYFTNNDSGVWTLEYGAVYNALYISNVAGPTWAWVGV
jgi:hypothetical protein